MHGGGGPLLFTADRGLILFLHHNVCLLATEVSLSLSLSTSLYLSLYLSLSLSLSLPISLSLSLSSLFNLPKTASGQMEIKLHSPFTCTPLRN